MNQISLLGTAVGITGTRAGCTDLQLSTGIELIEALEPPMHILRHGDCVGADQQVHDALKARNPDLDTISHPPLDDKYRAYCDSEIIRDPKGYLTRNQDIVVSSDILFAFPDGTEPRLRSGTWSTVRYATKIHKPNVVVFPDGTVRYDYSR